MVGPENTPLANAGAAARGEKLLAVASGKGGVGKTWFSITLAQALSQRGQRTLLFDADLGLANVDIQLGLMPERDLAGVIAGRLRLAQATVRLQSGPFDVIAGRSGAGNLASLPSHRVQSLGDELVALSDAYDRTIMDMGAGLDRTVRSLASRATTLFIVTTPEPTALTDAYAFIKVAAQNQPDADIRVVVNQVDSKAEGRRTYETLRKAAESFLKFTPALAGVIRRDRKVVDAIRVQIPLMTRHPSTAAAVDVQTLVDGLLRSR